MKEISDLDVVRLKRSRASIYTGSVLREGTKVVRFSIVAAQKVLLLGFICQKKWLKTGLLKRQTY